MPALLWRSPTPRRRKTTQTWTRIGALVTAPARAAGGRRASRCSRSARSATSSTRGYLDSRSSTATVPESVQGQELIAERFDPIGRVAPVDVVVDSNVALEVRDALARVPFVAVARRPTRRRRWPDLDRGAAEGRPVLAGRDGPDRTIARRGLRAPASGQLALIGGVTATNHDNRQALNGDARLIVPLMLGLILLVLIVLLRCLVAPLYLIATVVLSFAFSLGIAVAGVREHRSEPGAVRLHLPRRARGRRQHLPDDAHPRGGRRRTSRRGGSSARAA